MSLPDFEVIRVCGVRTVVSKYDPRVENSRGQAVISLEQIHRHSAALHEARNNPLDFEGRRQPKRVVEILIQPDQPQSH